MSSGVPESSLYHPAAQQHVFTWGGISAMLDGFEMERVRENAKVLKPLLDGEHRSSIDSAIIYWLQQYAPLVASDDATAHQRTMWASYILAIFSSGRNLSACSYVAHLPETPVFWQGVASNLDRRGRP